MRHLALPRAAQKVGEGRAVEALHQAHLLADGHAPARCGREWTGACIDARVGGLALRERERKRERGGGGRARERERGGGGGREGGDRQTDRQTESDTETERHR